MANSNTTLASLWVDDGLSSPHKLTPITPTKSGSSSNSKDDFLQYYKNSGLDSMAKD
ncbi:transcription factor Dp-1-like isoform X4, partial [Biomphalaria pfeifferi]